MPSVFQTWQLKLKGLQLWTLSISCWLWDGQAWKLSWFLGQGGLKGQRLRIVVTVILLLLTVSCVRLFVTPRTVVRQAPSVHGISQARIPEWVVISFSWDSGIESTSPALAVGFFTIEPPGKTMWCYRDLKTQKTTNIANYLVKEFDLFKNKFNLRNRCAVSQTACPLGWCLRIPCLGELASGCIWVGLGDTVAGKQMHGCRLTGQRARSSASSHPACSRTRRDAALSIATWLCLLVHFLHYCLVKARMKRALHLRAKQLSETTTWSFAF